MQAIQLSLREKHTHTHTQTTNPSISLHQWSLPNLVTINSKVWNVLFLLPQMNSILLHQLSGTNFFASWCTMLNFNVDNFL